MTDATATPATTQKPATASQQPARETTVLVTVMHANVLACGENKPPEKGKEKSWKPCYGKVLWDTTEEVDGERIATREIVKLNSHVPLQKGIQTLLITVTKIDFSTFYTVNAIVDPKQTVAQLLLAQGALK